MSNCYFSIFHPVRQQLNSYFTYWILSTNTNILKVIGGKISIQEDEQHRTHKIILNVLKVSCLSGIDIEYCVEVGRLHFKLTNINEMKMK